MSGGGVNGAWEAGVLWGFLNYGDPKDFEWDVVSGVSAGCINAGGVGLWAKGTELEMVKWMEELWGKVKTADIYQSWPGGALLTGPFSSTTTFLLTVVWGFRHQYLLLCQLCLLYNTTAQAESGRERNNKNEVSKI